VTIRITLTGQLAKGVRSQNAKLAAELAEELERLKWYLSHGSVFLALQTIDYLQLHVDYADLRIMPTSVRVRSQAGLNLSA